MDNPVRVNLFQGAIAVFVVTIGTVFFPVAGVVVPIVGQAGWIAVLLGFLIPLPWVFMAAALVRKGPIGEWGQSVKAWLGPWVGRVFLLYIAFCWAWLGGLLLAQGGMVFHNIALPATPPWIMSFALLILVVLADMRGVEVYVRSIELLVMVCLPFVTAFYLAILPTMQLENLQPLLGDGPIRLAHAVYLVIPWAMEGILFGLFIGTHIKNNKRFGLTISLAVFGGGAALALLTAFTLGVLGRGVTETYLYPTVELAQTARVGFFLQGIEIFLYPLWFLASYIKTGAAFVVVSESLRGVWAGATQPYRSLALGVLFFAVSQVPNTVQQVVASLGRVDSTFFMAFYVIIPALLLWVSIARKGDPNQSANS
ncbi:MAG: spore germination protein amino acid permease [Bacillota bacterium]|nr:MAG: spore germination protein amino acid permease [Bacillota bacterium]MBS3951170.1 GerAB/ArcD/ProY family transporter [Peptococcaceae bacterium]